MTTTTIFGDTSDGLIVSQDAVYATALAGTGGISVTTTGALEAVGQHDDGAQNYVRQLGLAFDTSVIPDTDAVQSVELSLASNEDVSDQDFTVEVRGFDWGATYTAADWRTPANLGTDTLLASRSTVGWSTAGYNVFASEAAFTSYINGTGFTRFVVCSSRNRLQNDPALGTGERVTVYMADEAGTANDPKLVITHGPVSVLVNRRSFLG